MVINIYVLWQQISSQRDDSQLYVQLIPSDKELINHIMKEIVISILCISTYLNICDVTFVSFHTVNNNNEVFKFQDDSNRVLKRKAAFSSPSFVLQWKLYQMNYWDNGFPSTMLNVLLNGVYAKLQETVNHLVRLTV
jgi:hypothetical protein